MIARFTIGEHEVRAMQEWSVGGARPCVLGVVTADNDYAFASAPGGPNLVTARNNLAERTLTIVPDHERREREDSRELEDSREPAVELTLNVKVNGRDARYEVRERL